MLKHTLLLTLTVCAIAPLSIPQPAYAQISEFKITASDGAAGDVFGHSVSISGDHAVVGAWLDDDNGTNSGSAYVFKRTGTSWMEEAKLLASDGAAGDLFGVSVSISGDYVIVGASGNDATGAAYVFKRTGTSWTQEAKLSASDGASFDYFGGYVSLSGDYAIVTAFADDDAGEASGSAYVFKRTGTSWTQEAKLLPSDGGAGDQFGASISISGDYAVVGARRSKVYVFKRTGTSWSQEATLLPSEALGGLPLVSLYGDYAALHGGSAFFVFKRTGSSWAQEAKLRPLGRVSAFSVSISADFAVLGAGYSGSAYVFKRTGTTWAPGVKLLSSDGETDDGFGFAVSISADYAIVTAPFDDDNGDNSGSAYVYSGFTDAIYAERVTVYPGDTDNNGIVDALDVLPIGVYFLSQGNARDTIAISWSPAEMWPWEVDAATFVDANGDGIVDERDVIAIGVNWGNTHTNTSASFAINHSDATLLNLHRDAFREIYNSLSGESMAAKSMRELLEGILSIQVPKVFALHQNYPNPFNPRTTISFQLPADEIVTLTVFNLLGQVVTVPVDKKRYDAGIHTVQLDGENFSSGVYLYQIKAGQLSAVRKMLVIK